MLPPLTPPTGTRGRKGMARITTTKNDLARQVAQACSMSIPDAEAAIDAMLRSIAQSVKAGNRVELRNFGVFLQAKNFRRGRHAIPGATPGIKVGFRTASALKDLQNQHLLRKPRFDIHRSPLQ